MPISGPASYLPTMDEFLAHWASANAAFGAPITLRGNVGVTDLQTLRDNLATAQTNLTGKINDREFARGSIETGAAALATRVEQFNARVRALYDTGPYVNALPLVPNPQASQSKVTTPMDDAANIWAKIEDDGPEIVLSGNYDKAQFDNDLAVLKQAYTAYTKAVSNEKLARGQRNDLQDQIQPILKQYRQIIPTYFDADSAIVESLPRLTPLPGATPKAVNASAVWDAAESKARLVWDASDNASLKEYQVRYSPGEEYKEEDAAVVATTLPDAPRELLTNAGLTQAGATATFKVFVVVDTGNEAGSESLTVTRPSAA